MSDDWIETSVQRRAASLETERQRADEAATAERILLGGLERVWDFVREQASAAAQQFNAKVPEGERVSFTTHATGFGLDRSVHPQNTAVFNLDKDERQVSCAYFCDGDNDERIYEVRASGSNIYFWSPEGRQVSQANMPQEMLERFFSAG